MKDHPNAEVVIVHCAAGVSRSAAVAAALEKVINGTDAHYFESARYRPNMLVYRRVLRAWEEVS